LLNTIARITKIMTVQQQAYIYGFVKRAAEYGFSENEAIELLKQAEPAANITPAKPLGLVGRAKQWIGSKLPGYPTSVGNTSGAVDDMAKRFQEQAGG
jgi:hypothetical protein